LVLVLNLATRVVVPILAVLQVPLVIALVTKRSLPLVVAPDLGKPKFPMVPIQASFQVSLLEIYNSKKASSTKPNFLIHQCAQQVQLSQTIS
jgi:hypothetical protein